MQKKVVVLLSGGMDSVTLLHQSVKNYEVLAALTFDYGSKHNHREIPFAAYHAGLFSIPHRIVRMRFIGELFRSALLMGGEEVPDGHYAEPVMQKTVVPFRNGIMLSVAAGYAESIEASGLAIAAHVGDHAIYPDCREDFMQSMGKAIQLGTYANIELIRPFIHMDKAAIALAGKELGVDYSRTWSCYKGGKYHCGTCGTCYERKEAFELAAMDDPTVYL